MSDTTSFLGGAALAGLAAVIVLRGGVNASLPTSGSNAARLPLPPSLPPIGNVTQDFATANPATVPIPQSAIAKAELGYEEAKLRLEMDQLKSQFEQQQQQIRNQQALIDNLTLQAKAQNLAAPSPVPSPIPPAPSARQDEASSLAAGLPWALGGVLLTFGGGIALVGMMSMFTKQNNRPVRTVEYVHDDYAAYMSARRRPQQVLPPRRTLRRVDLEDVE